jgi:hypothetical protein
LRQRCKAALRRPDPEKAKNFSEAVRYSEQCPPRLSATTQAGVMIVQVDF